MIMTLLHLTVASQGILELHYGYDAEFRRCGLFNPNRMMHVHITCGWSSPHQSKSPSGPVGHDPFVGGEVAALALGATLG